MKICIAIPSADPGQAEAMYTFCESVVKIKGHEPTSLHNFTDDENTTSTAIAVGVLLESDALLLRGEWQTDKTCRLLHSAALIYDKRTYTNLNQIQSIT